VFGLGDAGYHGSMGAVRLNKPVTGIAATPSGNGYHLVAADGGVFNFGDAHSAGSMGNVRRRSLRNLSRKNPFSTGCACSISVLPRNQTRYIIVLPGWCPSPHTV